MPLASCKVSSSQVVKRCGALTGSDHLFQCLGDVQLGHSMMSEAYVFPLCCSDKLRQIASAACDRSRYGSVWNRNSRRFRAMVRPPRMELRVMNGDVSKDGTPKSYGGSISLPTKSAIFGENANCTPVELRVPIEDEIGPCT